MHRAIEFAVCDLYHGLNFKSEYIWNESNVFKFNIRSRSGRKIVTSTGVSLNGCVTRWRSISQKHASLSVTKVK